MSYVDLSTLYKIMSEYYRYPRYIAMQARSNSKLVLVLTELLNNSTNPPTEKTVHVGWLLNVNSFYHCLFR